MGKIYTDKKRGNAGLIRCANAGSVAEKTLASALADVFFTTSPCLETKRNPAIFVSDFEGEQPEVGPQGESRLGEMSRKTASRQLRRRSGLGKPANQMNGFLLGELYSSERNERVKLENYKTGLIRCANAGSVAEKTLASGLADAFSQHLPAWRPSATLYFHFLF